MPWRGVVLLMPDLIYKPDLIQEIGRATGLKRKDIKVTLDCALHLISDHISQGHRVVLVGFGSWGLRVRKKIQRTMPGSDTKIEIPARWKVAFRPSDRMKRMISDASDGPL